MYNFNSLSIVQRIRFTVKRDWFFAFDHKTANQGLVNILKARSHYDDNGILMCHWGDGVGVQYPFMTTASMAKNGYQGDQSECSYCDGKNICKK